MVWGGQVGRRPELLEREVGERKVTPAPQLVFGGWLFVAPPPGGGRPVGPDILQDACLLIPSPPHFGFWDFSVKTLGMVSVGTVSKGLLLYLDNLIYCFMWQN